MVQDEDILEKDDMFILGRMREFLRKEEVYQFAAAKGLLTLIERSVSRPPIASSRLLDFRNQSHETKAKVTVTASQTAPPPPILPKTSRPLKLLDIEPLELARQLTIMESRLYQDIKPMECLQRSRENRADYKDNITNVTQNFNRVRLGDHWMMISR
jgi:son of sevenless-like protein